MENYEQLIYDAIGVDVSRKTDLQSFATDKDELKNLIIAARNGMTSEKDMHYNMQYYMEYCQVNGYVTPMRWLNELRHF